MAAKELTPDDVIKTLKGKYMDCLKANKRLQSDLATKTRKLDNMISVNDRLNRDLGLAVEGRDKLGKALRELQGERTSEAKERAEEAAANVDSLKGKLDGIAAEVSSTATANEALREENRSLRGKLTKLYATLEEGKNIYEQQLAAKDAVVEAEQARLGTFAATLTKQQGLLDKLTGMVAAAQQGEADANAAAAAYKEQADAAREAVAGVRSELTAFTKMARELGELRTAKSAVDTALLQEAAGRQTLAAQLTAAAEVNKKQAAQVSQLQGLCRALRAGSAAGEA